VHCRARVQFSANTLVASPPPEPLWDLGAFRLSAESRFASGRIGGDFYAFEQRDAKHLAIVIGDACGRGSEGARLLSGVLPGLEELARCTNRPSRLLKELNRRIIGEMPSDRFVTGAAFEFDAEAGTLTVANAGHVPAILRSARGKVNVIGRASGPPLGVFSDASYTDQRYRIGKDDVVVFMTDGILELVETDLAEMQTLMALVAEAPAGSRGVHRFLLANVDGRVEERTADDMTLLSLEVLLAPARTSRMGPARTSRLSLISSR
jgi:serine phosphatase RsbU (regulator of sigma subunit)